MTDEQVYLIIGSNLIVVLVGILINNARLGDLSKHLDSRIDSLMVEVNAKFETAHGNLLRVEQVLDARLKSLER